MEQSTSLFGFYPLRAVQKFIARQKMRIHIDYAHQGVQQNPAHFNSIDEIIKVDRAPQLRQNSRGRVWLVMISFVACFGLYALRLGDLSLFHIEAPTDHVADSFTISPSKDLAYQLRPEITDRNGRFLVKNMSVTGVAINTNDVWDAGEMAAMIAQHIDGVDAASLERRIQTKKHIVVKKEITTAEQEALHVLGLPGLTFPEYQKRIYPQGHTAAHLSGQTIAGRGGVMGLEGALDKNIAQITDFGRNQPTAIAATIDMAAQQILEEELIHTMRLYDAKAAWGVVLDSKTGEVIALASLPDFNPNYVAQFPDDHRRNRVLYDRYELGSAFKALTVAAAMDAGYAQMSTKIDTRHPIDIMDKKIRDYHPRGGFQTVREVLRYSSNIGVATLANQMGVDQHKEYYRDLGLLTPLESELIEKRASDVPKLWGAVENATISYGHGIAVTPMQLTAAFNAVVNDGHYITPSYLMDTKMQSNQVFSSQTSATMRLMLRDVVTHGTGRRADVPGYYVIGKTATADKPAKSGGYDKDRRLSSFVGAFPGYDPKYTILVSFDEPKPLHGEKYATAGIVAAPAFANIVERLGPAMGVAPTKDDTAFAGFLSHIPVGEQQILADYQITPNKNRQAMDEMGQIILTSSR